MLYNLREPPTTRAPSLSLPPRLRPKSVIHYATNRASLVVASQDTRYPGTTEGSFQTSRAFRVAIWSALVRPCRKGLQYLQTNHLLPEPINPTPVAAFLRLCPTLSRTTVGEILGQYDQLLQQVRLAGIDGWELMETGALCVFLFFCL